MCRLQGPGVLQCVVCASAKSAGGGIVRGSSRPLCNTGGRMDFTGGDCKPKSAALFLKIGVQLTS